MEAVAWYRAGGTKAATLETGAVIQVPLFIAQGEIIKVRLPRPPPGNCRISWMIARAKGAGQ